MILIYIVHVANFISNNLYVKMIIIRKNYGSSFVYMFAQMQNRLKVRRNSVELTIYFHEETYLIPLY